MAVSTATVARALPLAAALLAVGSLLPAAASAAGEAAVAWPSNVSVRTGAVVRQALETEGSLPRLHVFAPDGTPLLRIDDYDTDELQARLVPLLAGGTTPAPGVEDLNLAAELSVVRDAAGKPIAMPAPARLTLVQYGAPWCLPCHALTGELRRMTGEHPRTPITLVEVDADMTRAMGNPREGAPAEVVETLSDPALSSAERDEALISAFRTLHPQAKTQATPPPP